MNRMKLLLIVLFSVSLLKANAQEISPFNIVFTYNDNTVVDFEKGLIKNAGLEDDSIHFSAKEERLIKRSFDKNHMADAGGEIFCLNDTMVNTPSANWKVDLFKNGQHVAFIFLDAFYYIDKADKNRKDYMPASFVNDLKKMLDHNRDFKRSYKKRRKDERDHHYIEL